MGFLAVIGIWRNNLIRFDTNWPWAIPLAGLALLGHKFRRLILVHCIVFVPLTCLLLVMIPMSGYGNRLDQVWYAPFSIAAIGVLNVVFFRILAAKVEN